MKYSQSKGVGLLEIMIAILLSAIVLAGIFRYSYYLETVLNFSASEVDAIEKNNVIFAWMVRDIEMAGYVGCVNASSRKSIHDEGHYLRNTWLLADGNTLISQYMSPQTFVVIEKSNDAEILISGHSFLKEGDIVFIENCWEAETAKIKKIHSVNYGEKNRVEFYAPLKMKNIDNTYVAKMIRHDYVIKNSGLYVKNEKDDSDEVLENIVSFNVSRSQTKFIVSITEFNNTDPILLTASAYNVG